MNCPHCRRPVPASDFLAEVHRNREAILRALRVVRSRQPVCGTIKDEIDPETKARVPVFRAFHGDDREGGEEVRSA
jgi:hypothetical protein